MYNNQLVYKVVIWAFFGISLWTEKVALSLCRSRVFLAAFRSINIVYVVV